MRTKYYKIWPLRLRVLLGVNNAGKTKDSVDQDGQRITCSANIAHGRGPVKMRHRSGQRFQLFHFRDESFQYDDHTEFE